jgi:hypothetical protein
VIYTYSDWLRAGQSGARILVGARFSVPIQTGPGAHPASYTMGTGSLSQGVKWPGRGFDHPPPSCAKVKERVELYLYSPSGPSWPGLGWPLPLPLYIYIYLCISWMFKKKQVRILLQLKPNNALNLIKIIIILQHTSSYTFWALQAHCQGAHDYTKLLLNIYCSTGKSRTTSCCDICLQFTVWSTTYMLLLLLCGAPKVGVLQPAGLLYIPHVCSMFPLSLPGGSTSQRCWRS